MPTQAKPPVRGRLVARLPKVEMQISTNPIIPSIPMIVMMILFPVVFFILSFSFAFVMA